MEYNVDKISSKIKNKKIKHKIFKIVLLSILFILFIINLILSFEENTHICGIYVFNIISESMVPTLDVNDVVVVKKCKPTELQVGDIITYEIDGRTVSHRIIQITKDANVLITTKGDNNEVQDPVPIKGDQVFGKMLFRVRKIGKIVGYIQNVRGLINIVIFIFIVYILISLKEQKKNTRKIKRKKYEIKKLRDNYHL